MNSSELVSLIIEPRAKDVGGFGVRRVLPHARCRTVGPFIFFDHMGPVDFPPGQGIDVRPHPHIGLATVTYLFEGEIFHRDSLGVEQAIRPGAVNWMNAGRGIVHSERTGDEERAKTSRLNGIQSWIALPLSHEECEPSFHHHPADSLPIIKGRGVRMCLIAGSAYGKRAPVETPSEMFYLDAVLSPGAELILPDEYEERAIYVVEGAVRLDGGTEIGEGKMAVFHPSVEVGLSAQEAARVMLLGGRPLDGKRHLWWNFVASTPERLERAKADWKNRCFDPVPGDHEFIPLPES
ncbi:pirin family protein [Pelagibius sp. Alg239-R121]|uniref:pirin family protein n=1 Tax=Pelagibius sp. Alg239-R121 TaxID=2993448 RepID=UPI0024A73A57|nr:pirin family protein [Pelagibius sp. Alg239-R121]